MLLTRKVWQRWGNNFQWDLRLEKKLVHTCIYDDQKHCCTEIQSGILLVSFDLPGKLKYGTECTYTANPAVCGTDGEQSGDKAKMTIFQLCLCVFARVVYVA